MYTSLKPAGMAVIAPETGYNPLPHRRRHDNEYIPLSRHGAPSRKRCVVNGQRQATNENAPPCPSSDDRSYLRSPDIQARRSLLPLLPLQRTSSRAIQRNDKKMNETAENATTHVQKTVTNHRCLKSTELCTTVV